MKARSAITRREWMWVGLWTLAYLALTGLPYLIGALASTPENRFGGFVYNIRDCYSYIAKMQQGARGEWLFTLPYTSEPHQGAFIYPFYLILGKLGALTGLSMTATYHLARPVCALMLFATLYALLAHFTARVAVRKIAFWLCMFSAGLGWLFMLLGRSHWLGDLPLDFWVPEGYLFLLAYATPHLTFAGGLLFALLCLVIDGWQAHSWRPIALSAAVGLLLTAILPFYAAVGYTVLGAAWLVEAIRGHAPNWRRLAMLVASGLPSLPMLAYQAWVFTVDPFFSVWAAQNLTRSPHPLHYLLGYAPLIPFALGGLFKAFQNRHKLSLLFLVWPLATAILVYLPVQFQRRFLIGVQVPLAFWAAEGIARSLLPFSRSRPVRWLLRWPRYSMGGLRRWALTAVILFAAATHLLTLTGNALEARMGSERIFHSADELAAFAWLRTHTTPDEVVLSAFDTGNIVPAYAGNRVFLGHGPETVRADEKKALVARFFDAQTEDEWRRSLLREYGIAYVLIGPRERALGTFDPASTPYLSLVYENESYVIYRFI